MAIEENYEITIDWEGKKYADIDSCHFLRDLDRHII